MATTIVEAGRTVVGGVDTHLDVHVAAALDPIGGVLGVESFAATPRGYRAMLEWMGGFGTLSKVGVEGTGSYGAGLGRFLGQAGVEVIEVDRPNRQVRRTKGKSDPADAVEAARAVLSGRCTGAPKTKDGNVEAIRALLVAKRSAREGRLRAVNQMRQLTYTGPDQLRSRLKGLSITDLVAETAAMRPRAVGDPVVYATKVSLAALGRRVLSLEDEIAGTDSLLADLVTTYAPTCSSSSAWASTPPPPCSSPPATTPNACAQKPLGPISVAWPPSRPPRARSRVTASIAAGIATPTKPCGASS